MPRNSRRVMIDSGILRGSSISEKSSSKGPSSSSSSSSKFDLEEMISEIRGMKPLSHLIISSLDSTTRKKLERMREAAFAIRKGNVYKGVVSAIKDTFGDVEGIKPLTVGAFFYGCFLKNEYDGKLECGELCSGSMPAPFTPGSKNCDVNVAVYTSNGMTYTNSDSKSDELILHVGEDFEGISERDAKSMNERGIKKLVISGKSWSKSKSGSPESYVSTSSSGDSKENFFGEKSGFSGAGCPVRQRECNTENNSFALYAVGAVILLILLGIICFFFYRHYYSVHAEACAPQKEICPPKDECASGMYSKSMMREAYM